MSDPKKVASPLVELLRDGNWPSEQEAQRLRDELYYQRAIHIYMTVLPDGPSRTEKDQR